MRPIRVLVVDDSPTVRRLLVAALSRDPAIMVVGEAPEPATARQMIKDLAPDVLTLDVEMPGMNGLEFLERIMRLRPMPVVMVSTLTQRGADVTLEALELGAVDFFPKPTSNVAALLEAGAPELVAKIKAAASARVRPRSTVAASAPAANDGFDPGEAVIAIGASTGGVEALICVLGQFPKNCPPTVIVQHMPPHFTTSFAGRLDRLCAPRVTEAVDGAPLAIGQVYLAPGGTQHLEVSGLGTMRCKLSPGEPASGHRPSADMLFASVAKVAGARAVGALLTGMGRDGADGLLRMRKAGASTIGQDEQSCVVYGMPRAAFENGAAERQLPLERIGAELLRLSNRRGRG